MGGGGPVTQAWINEAKGAMGGKLEPQQTTAPTANTMGGARAGFSSSALALLNKTAEQKRSAVADVGEARGAMGAAALAFQRAPSEGVAFGRTPSLRDAVKRAQEAEKLKAEQERVRITVEKVRVSIKYIKHLPKV